VLCCGFIILIIISKLSNNINLSGNYFVENQIDDKILIESRTVQGKSLTPLIKTGQRVKVFINYYHYYPVERNDVVLITYAGSKNPLIKIVKGLPGDSFSLQKVSDELKWNILINNNILKNSEGKSYIIGNAGYKMLSLYEKDYQGIIPENAYLVLGNIVSGSLDSTRFGLINKTDILGKVDF